MKKILGQATILFLMVGAQAVLAQSAPPAHIECTNEGAVWCSGCLETAPEYYESNWYECDGESWQLHDSYSGSSAPACSAHALDCFQAQ